MGEHARITVTIILLLAGCAAGSSTALGQGTIARPRALAQPPPPAPSNRAGAVVGGWAVVRFSVGADGALDNVRVVATAPPGIDTAATVDATRQWRFAPATHDGAAIDWHNFESVVLYPAPPPPAAASSEFDSRYRAVRTLLERPPPIDLQAAADANRQLLEQAAIRIDELGLAIAQSAIIAVGREDWHAAYDAVRLVTDPRVPALRGEDLFVGLQLRMQLADRLGRAADALETYARIAARLDPAQPDPFARGAEALRARLTNDPVLQAAGFIGQGPWRIAVARRTFTLADIDGGIRRIGVECDRRRLELEYRPDVEWRLPAGWGDCELFVAGEPGTTFRFFEFLTPAQPAE